MKKLTAEEEFSKVLAEVRDILLPLVNTEGNICGDMVACTVSEPSCVICLAKRLVYQFKTEK